MRAGTRIETELPKITAVGCFFAPRSEPRSKNNETTITIGHRELRDPCPTHPTVDLGDWGLR